MIELPEDAPARGPTKAEKGHVSRRYAHCSSAGQMLSRALAIASVSVACSGCFLFQNSDDSPPIEEPIVTSGSAEAGWALEVGQGETAFAPLEDGAHVSKVHGFQGGYHVFVAARLEGANVRGELTAKASSSGYSYANVEVEVASGTRIVSRSNSITGVSPKDETSVDFVSLYAYVDADVRGDVTITVKIATDDRTKWASASRHVFIDG
jgi:hypothetical protein